MDIRVATREDLPAVEQVRISTWQVAYRGIVPDHYLDTMTLTPERVAWLEERWSEGSARTWVACEDDGVVGMAVTGPCRDDDRAFETELYGLYVLPSHWGTGAGPLLWDAAQPFTSLWVLSDNARARRFYERRGFRADRPKLFEVGGVEVPEIRYVLA